MLKVSTFCSGVGSPEQAIKNLGIEHEVVLTAEIDKYARQTYLANHHTNKMINDMTAPDYEGEEWYSDINISGLPCQSFSLAGKRSGELDPRGLLFFDFLRYVKNQQPKYFIIENVKGLLSSKSCITYRNTLYLLLHNFNKITKWEQLNSDQNSLNILSQNISNYLLLNFAKKLNLRTDKSGTYLNVKQGLSYETLEQRVGSGLKRRLKFLEERIYQITKKYNCCQTERIQQLEEQEADLDLLQDQLYLIENLIPLVTNLLEKTVDIDVNTQLFSNNLLEENLKTGKLYTTLTELNSITDSKTFFYVLESNIIRLIILALDLSPNLWKEIWLILTKKKEFIGLKTFDIWTSNLSNLLYNLHWQVLNTKDYGLPHNRERVFLIGIRNDLPNDFNFPKTIPLKLRLKDILEDEVDEKYYLSEKLIAGFMNKPSIESFPFQPLEIETDKVCPKITARIHKCSSSDPYLKIPSATKSGYEIAMEGDSINLEHPNSETRRGRVGKQVAQTLTTSCNQGVVQLNPSLESGGKQPYQQNRVYDSEGIAPALCRGKSDLNVTEIIQLNNPKHSNDRIYSDEGLSPTLNTMQGGNRQPFIQVIGSTGGKNDHNSRIYGTDGISPTILAGNNGGGQSPVKHLTHDYRIRKLSPLECFRLQGFSDEFVDKNNFIKSINKQGILVYICNEFKNKLLCNAKLKNVIEKQGEGDIASCTIKDSESMGTQISFLNTPIEEIKNAKYQVAIELFTQKDFVYHTTTPIENMEMLYTLTKEGKMLSTELSHPVEKEELEKMGDQNTDLLLRIILDENWKKEKLYIISTLIHTIMKSVTCMCMNQSQNTLRCIVSYEELPKKQKQPTKNSFEMESFVLKTANTSYVSSGQLYKQAGNSISVPVIQAILKNLLT